MDESQVAQSDPQRSWHEPEEWTTDVGGIRPPDEKEEDVVDSDAELWDARMSPSIEQAVKDQRIASFEFLLAVERVHLWSIGWDPDDPPESDVQLPLFPIDLVHSGRKDHIRMEVPFF